MTILTVDRVAPEKSDSFTGLRQSTNESNQGKVIMKYAYQGNIRLRLSRLFSNIKKRCYNTRCYKYKNYGARGIDVYSEWLKDPHLFVDWALTNGYEIGKQCDRIDNDKGYHPDNLRFTDDKTQQNNKRNTKYIEYQGKMMPCGIVATMIGMDSANFNNRLRYGWSLDRIISTPVNHYKEKNAQEKA